MSYFPWFPDTREGVGDRNKRSDFAVTVARKHFITKQDVRNVRVNVTDRLIMKHREDAMSVHLSVEQLRRSLLIL